VPKPRNTQLRYEREQAAPLMVGKQFAITLFAGVDEATVQPRIVDLDELAEMLTKLKS